MTIKVIIIKVTIKVITIKVIIIIKVITTIIKAIKKSMITKISNYKTRNR